MAHFAKVKNGTVLDVIVAEQDFIDGLDAEEGVSWVQTSYNTKGGQHSQSGTPLRKNFAGLGHKYDSDADAFYEPQPFPSWTLNTTTYEWEAPIAVPTDGFYEWSERTYQEDNTKGWVEVTISQS